MRRWMAPLERCEMRIDTALLCDAATERDGLLNVLGGGITVATRPEFPAPLGMTLALVRLSTPRRCRPAIAWRCFSKMQTGQS